MALYAAYGSNMDPAQMVRRCPSSPFLGTGWVRGWRLTFGAEEYGWEGALATLVPDEAPEQLHPGVFVALYDLTDADERALDAWEGADSGLYRRGPPPGGPPPPGAAPHPRRLRVDARSTTTQRTPASHSTRASAGVGAAAKRRERAMRSSTHPGSGSPTVYS